MTTWTTPKGTTLPLLNLKGKDYLQVAHRLVWFREDHPTWAIENSFLQITATSALAQATIKDDAGRVIATANKFEDKAGFGDFIEKSQTGAIGRALALIGYGTQFCADELDEGERIVDAPIQPGSKSRESSGGIINFPEYVLTFGKFKDRKVKDVPIRDLLSWINFLSECAVKDGKKLDGPAAQAYTAIHSYAESKQ